MLLRLWPSQKPAVPVGDGLAWLSSLLCGMPVAFRGSGGAERLYCFSILAGAAGKAERV